MKGEWGLYNIISNLLTFIRLFIDKEFVVGFYENGTLAYWKTASIADRTYQQSEYLPGQNASITDPNNQAPRLPAAFSQLSATNPLIEGYQNLSKSTAGFFYQEETGDILLLAAIPIQTSLFTGPSVGLNIFGQRLSAYTSILANDYQLCITFINLQNASASAGAPKPSSASQYMTIDLSASATALFSQPYDIGVMSSTFLSQRTCWSEKVNSAPSKRIASFNAINDVFGNNLLLYRIDSVSFLISIGLPTSFIIPVMIFLEGLVASAALLLFTEINVLSPLYKLTGEIIHISLNLAKSKKVAKAIEEKLSARADKSKKRGADGVEEVEMKEMGAGKDAEEEQQDDSMKRRVRQRKGHDEIALLASTFNYMMDKLERAKEDITKEERLRDVLEQSAVEELKSRSIMSAITYSVVSVRFDEKKVEGEIVAANKAFEIEFGYSLEEYQKSHQGRCLNVSQILEGINLLKLKEIYESHLTGAAPATSLQKERAVNAIRKDGRVFPAEISINKMQISMRSNENGAEDEDAAAAEENEVLEQAFVVVLKNLSNDVLLIQKIKENEEKLENIEFAMEFEAILHRVQVKDRFREYCAENKPELQQTLKLVEWFDVYRSLKKLEDRIKTQNTIRGKGELLVS